MHDDFKLLKRVLEFPGYLLGESETWQPAFKFHYNYGENARKAATLLSFS